MKVKDNQTIMDIALEVFGRIEGIYDIVDLNNLHGVLSNVREGDDLIIEGEVNKAKAAIYTQAGVNTKFDSLGKGVGWWIVDIDNIISIELPVAEAIPTTVPFTIPIITPPTPPPLPIPTIEEELIDPTTPTAPYRKGLQVFEDYIPIGIGDNTIPNEQLSASSESSPLQSAALGRFAHEWIPREDDNRQWWMVDAGEVIKVGKVGIRAKPGGDKYWITSYTLEYSKDGRTFTKYRNGQMLQGNTNDVDEVQTILYPFEARYIRFRPTGWKGAIAGAFEVYKIVRAEEYKEVGETALIPDLNFRRYIKQQIPTSFDGEYLKVEHPGRKLVTKIKASSLNIRTLDGIDLFPNVAQIELYNNDITSINLIKNPRVTFLDVSHNRTLNKIDLRRSPELTQLIAYNTGLKILDASQNLKLINVNSLGNYDLETLDIRGIRDANAPLEIFSPGVKLLKIHYNLRNHPKVLEFKRRRGEAMVTEVYTAPLNSINYTLFHDPRAEIVAEKERTTAFIEGEIDRIRADKAKIAEDERNTKRREDRARQEEEETKRLEAERLQTEIDLENDLIAQKFREEQEEIKRIAAAEKAYQEFEKEILVEIKKEESKRIEIKTEEQRVEEERVRLEAIQVEIDKVEAIIKAEEDKKKAIEEEKEKARLLEEWKANAAERERKAAEDKKKAEEEDRQRKEEERRRKEEERAAVARAKYEEERLERIRIEDARIKAEEDAIAARELEIEMAAILAEAKRRAKIKAEEDKRHKEAEKRERQRLDEEIKRLEEEETRAAVARERAEATKKRLEEEQAKQKVIIQIAEKEEEKRVEEEKVEQQKRDEQEFIDIETRERERLAKAAADKAKLEAAQSKAEQDRINAEIERERIAEAERQRIATIAKEAELARLAAERKRLDDERKRLEAERKAEEERLGKEAKEAEEAAARAKEEAERSKAEADRLAAEAAERERLRLENEEKERLRQKEDDDRIAREQEEARKRAEDARKEREKLRLENERKERERLRLEAEQRERDRLKAEEEAAAARAEAERKRLEDERIKAEKDAKERERLRLEAEQREKDKIKAEADRKQAERIANGYLIPDLQFRAYIRGKIPRAFDEEYLMKTSPLLAGVSNIDIGTADGKITDLSGLNLFPNLTDVNTTNHIISKAVFRQNPLLYEVFLPDTEQKELDFSQNVKLRRLLLNGRQLEELDLRGIRESELIQIDAPALKILRVHTKLKDHIDIRALKAERGDSLRIEVYSADPDKTNYLLLNRNYDPVETERLQLLKVKENQALIASHGEQIYDPNLRTALSELIPNAIIGDYVIKNRPEAINLRELNLAGRGISNFQVLSAFPNLTKLNVDNNPIEHLAIFNKLTNLSAANCPKIKSLSFAGITDPNATLNFDNSPFTALRIHKNLIDHPEVKAAEARGIDIDVYLPPKEGEGGYQYIGSLAEIRAQQAREKAEKDAQEAERLRLENEAKEAEKAKLEEERRKEEAAKLNLFYIPDANLRAAVKSLLPRIFDGEYIVKTHPELLRADTLMLDNKGIVDTKGIELFSRLKTLNAIDNNIRNIDLSKNTFLSAINIGNNPIENLDFTGNPVLKTIISYSNNELVSINTTKNSLLNSINLTNNTKIKNIDLSNNTGLLGVGIESNSNLATLDIRGLRHIDGVLSLQDNPKLTMLRIHKKLQDNPKINNLQDELGSKLIIEVYDAAPGSVIYTFINTLSGIRKSRLDATAEAERAKAEADRIKAELEKLAREGVLIPDLNFRAEIRKLMPDAFDGDYLLKAHPKVTSLDTLSINNKRILDLRGIEIFTTLTKLFVNGNLFVYADLSGLPKLTTVQINDNPRLRTIEFGENPNLITIQARKNLSLEELDVSKTVNLVSLYAHENPRLRTLDIKGMRNAIWFEIDNDGLTLLRIHEALKDNDKVLALYNKLGNKLRIEVYKADPGKMNYVLLGTLRELKEVEGAAEASRLEKERLEKERLEKERLEKERLERERLEKERLEREKLEREKLERERLERERLERERLERERLEREKLEREKLAGEAAERERQRLEAERIAAEKQTKQYLIPDLAFREGMQKLIPIAFEGEYINKDHAAVANLKRLDLAHLGIRSIEGIEIFQNVTNLYLTDNKLSTVDLSKNPNLTNIRLGENQLSELDLSNNINVVYLRVQRNPRLVSLDIRGIREVTTLVIENENITLLKVHENLRTNDKVRELKAHRGDKLKFEVYSASPGQKNYRLLPPQPDDVKPVDKYVSIGISEGLFPDSSFTASSSHDAKYAPHLVRLNKGTPANWNPLGSDKKPWWQLDMGEEMKIGRVATQGRARASHWIKSYKLAYSNDGLNFTDYNNGEVLSGNTNRNIVVPHDLIPFTARYIRLYPISWQAFPTGRWEFYKLEAVGYLIPDLKFREVIRRAIPNSFDGDYLKVKTPAVAALTTIDGSNKQIDRVDGMEYYPGLRNLNLSFNKINFIDLTHNLALTDVDVSGNTLSYLDISYADNLVIVYAANNKISELYTSNNPKVKIIDINRNNVTELDLAYNPLLETLQANNNFLISLDTSKNPRITDVRVQDNPGLVTLDLRGMRRVTALLVNAPITLLKIHESIKEHAIIKEFIAKRGAAMKTEVYTSSPGGIDYRLVAAPVSDTRPKALITDVNLRNVIKGVTPNAFVGEELLLDHVETKNLTSISAGNKGIRSLQGNWAQTTGYINHLFPKLSVLEVENNTLDGISIRENIGLKVLNILNNNIVHLDTRRNRELEVLLTSGNPITTLDLSQNTKLVEYVHRDSINRTSVLHDLDLRGMRTIQNLVLPSSLTSLKAHVNLQGSEEITALKRTNPGINIEWFSAPPGSTTYTKVLTPVTPVAPRGGKFLIPDAILRAEIKRRIPEAFEGEELLLDSPELPKVTRFDLQFLDIQSWSGIEYFPNISSISLSHTTQVKEIDISGKANIKRLGGNTNYLLRKINISNNPGLTYIFLGDNPLLQEIDVSKNPELKSLHLRENVLLKGVDISKNLKLTEFSFTGSPLLRELNLSNNKELTEVIVTSNALLRELDLSKNNKLNRVSTDNNPLLRELNLSNNKELTRVRIGNNALLRELDLSKNNKLESVLIENNPLLTTLDIRGMRNPQTLRINNDNITLLKIHENLKDNDNIKVLQAKRGSAMKTEIYSAAPDSSVYSLVKATTRYLVPDLAFRAYLKRIKPTAFEGEELIIDSPDTKTFTKLLLPRGGIVSLEGIEYLPELTEIRARDNRIENLDISKNPKLTYLSVGGNKLKRLYTTHNPNLTSVYASNNPDLTSVDLRGVRRIEELSLDKSVVKKIKIHENIAESTYIKDWKGEQPDMNFMVYSAAPGSTTYTYNTYITVAAHGEEERARRGRKVYIPDHNFRGAIKSIIPQTFEREMMLADHPAVKGLRSIKASNNGISSLEGIENFPNLEELKCDKNHLSVLDVSKNNKLMIIEVEENQLGILSLGKQPELYALSCYKNSIKTLHIQGAPKLGVLWVDNNPLSELDVTKAKGLKILFCKKTNIKTLDLANNLELEILNIENNPYLTTLDIRALRTTGDFKYTNNSIAQLYIHEGIKNTFPVATMKVENRALNIDVYSADPGDTNYRGVLYNFTPPAVVLLTQIKRLFIEGGMTKAEFDIKLKEIFGEGYVLIAPDIDETIAKQIAREREEEAYRRRLEEEEDF